MEDKDPIESETETEGEDVEGHMRAREADVEAHRRMQDEDEARREPEVRRESDDAAADVEAHKFATKIYPKREV